jgi:hypothetical protein
MLLDGRLDEIVPTSFVGAESFDEMQAGKILCQWVELKPNMSVCRCHPTPLTLTHIDS